MKKIGHFILFMALLIALPAGDAGASQYRGAVDHGIYANLLKKYAQGGLVDYRGLKNEEAKLDQYLALLEKISTKALSPNELFSFYINAYNAWTIKLILSRYPDIKSIKDLGTLFKSPWKKEIARIDGETLTLDHIEHNIIRPRFKDPRVHFAINCASIGCPPLLPEPYQGISLNQQLDGVTRDFINDPKRYRLEGRTLYVSKIFDWFEGDFNNDVIGFFLKYAEEGLRKRLLAQRDKIKIRHLDYDWSLNRK